jgi:hypothetical protein
MGLSKWTPWEDYEKDPEILDIKRPPCEDCMFWNPQRTYHEGVYKSHFSGLVLCHAENMHKDFSCFKARRD